MLSRRTGFDDPLLTDPALERFSDRVAVVTGAGSGIGLALAERFAAEGMKIVMADVEAAALDAAVAAVRAKAPAVLAVRVDVSRAEDVERLARETYAAFGAAHAVCNNAGVAVIGAVHEHSLADWQWVMGVNLWGVIHGVRAFVRSEEHTSELQSQSNL